MKPSFIIDCSITMAWCFADEATSEASEIQDRLATEAAVVPSLWFLEVANVLVMAEKRQRISADDSSEFLSLLSGLDIEEDTESSVRAFNELLPLCRDHGLTSYDAAYLDLALRKQVPLASLDDQLRQAAKALGLTVLGK